MIDDAVVAKPPKPSIAINSPVIIKPQNPTDANGCDKAIKPIRGTVGIKEGKFLKKKERFLSVKIEGVEGVWSGELVDRADAITPIAVHRERRKLPACGKATRADYCETISRVKRPCNKTAKTVYRIEWLR